MKYTFTHYRSFNRRAIPITVAASAIILALFSYQQYLIGGVVAGVAFGVLYVCQRFSQLRMAATNKGISFLRGRHYSFIGWDDIASVKKLSVGLQLELKEERDYSMALPSNDEKDRKFQRFCNTIKSICELKNIEFNVTGR